MTFADLETRLREEALRRVRSGQFTERGLARAAGLSQPHVHNLLKGVRGLTAATADRLLDSLELSVTDLAAAPDPRVDAVPLLAGPAGGGRPWPRRYAPSVRYLFHAADLAALTRPVLVRLASDPALPLLFQAGDLVLLDRAPEARSPGRTSRWALVVLNGSSWLRRIALDGDRIRFEPPAGGCAYLSPSRRSILEIPGRLVWLSRYLVHPWPKTDSNDSPPESTR